MSSKKSLAVALSKLAQVENPKVHLEQFTTPGNIASELLWSAYMNGDIEGKSIIDYGAGTGILGIGALLLDAKNVEFIEVDKDLIELLKKNIESITGFDNYTIIKSDATKYDGKADTIIMNPPFGAVTKNADKAFLQNAFRHTHKIYSMHNANSRKFLQSLCKDSGFNLKIVNEVEFSLKKTHWFHKKPVQKINVILCLMEKINEKSL